MGLTRSEQMSRIRGKDTAPEMKLRRALWAAGLRYRVHYKTPGGTADLALVGAKVAVFIDSCFFHGCPEHYVRPRSNTPFWAAKLRENVGRDRRQTLRLEADQWRVCRVWEHEVYADAEAVVSRIRRLTAGVEPASGIDWRVVRADPVEGTDRQETWTLQDLRDETVTQTLSRVRTTHKGPRSRAKPTDPPPE